MKFSVVSYKSNNFCLPFKAFSFLFTNTLMAQQLLIESDSGRIDLKKLNESPESTIKMLIAQQSNGHINPNMLHSVIRVVMNSDDNKLKRMLYYFFETMDKSTKDFLVCINQVKKDLMSNNEYVRGFALQFASKIQNQEYAAMFLKDVKENINGKCTNVKINALFCLGELGRRFDFEVENIILESIRNESSPAILCIGFDAMDKLGMSFEEFLDFDYPKEVLELLIEKVDDIKFLKRMMNSRFNNVAFYASCKLLKKSIENESCMSNILRILESNPDYKPDFLLYLRFVTSNAVDLLSLIDPYDFKFSSVTIDTIFRIADTIDFVKIADFLYQKYIETGQSSEKKRSFKILLLEKMTTFSATHCIFVTDLIEDCFKNVESDDPDLVYASLNFLNTCLPREKLKSEIHNFLINNFSKIKFGKIIRRIFDILAEGISKKHFEELLDRLLADLQLDISESPVYLTNEPEVFVGAYISLNIAEMYDPNWDLKSKTLGTLLKILEIGSLRNIVDLSARSTINTCVRSILSNVSQQKIENKNFYDFSPISVLSPVEFSLLTPNICFKKFIWNDPLNANQSTVQLTGLGDPLYIEAECTHSKYEISLDLLIINQTSSYLQDMSIDFNFSKNIQMITAIEQFSLQPNSAITLKVQFSINETLSSFVTATVTFKYPHKDDYSGKPFVQNLSEIIFDVNQFLEGANVDFKKHWPLLEWENIYSLTIRKDCSDLLEKIGGVLNAHLCDKLDNFGFTVANLACYTLQKTLVLVNVCISSNSSSLVEIRVRSKNEDLVKTVSALLSNFLKSMQ